MARPLCLIARTITDGHAQSSASGRVHLGIDRKYALEGVDQGDARAIEEALKVLTGLGAKVVDVRTPDLASLLGA
jgi:Asp-tRNA(Asn)/Glu-tRNA(Gln) amidotransferase A subunit family amidase